MSSPCGSKKNFTNTTKKKTRDKLKKNLSVLFGLRLLWSSNHFVLCTFVFVLIFPRCQEYSFHRRNKDILPGKFSNFVFCLFFIFQLYGVVLPLRAECGKSVDRCILKNNLSFSTQLVNWLKILTHSKICLYLFCQIYFFVCLFFIFLTFLCLIQWQLIFQSTFLYWNLLKTAFLSVITDTEQDTHFV